MPELPEVETVRRGLEHALHGATIENVVLKRKDLRTAFPPNLAKTLTGRKIRGIERRAKYLLFKLDSDDVLIAHLGMTGRFLINLTEPKKFDKHDHLVMYLKDGRVLVFNDTRRFGLMTVARENEVEKHPLFARMGPEPFESAFSTSYLKEKLAIRDSAIKPVLMDQHLVVGVGNIYASEALFDCGINPKRKAKDVADKASAIIKSIHKTLDAAISSGGSSLRDFMNVDGNSGYFQHKFYVYGREGKPCLKCKTPIKMIRQGSRSTFFCPSCQK